MHCIADDDRVSVSSPIPKVEAVGASALVEPTSSKFEDGSDDAEEISEFCSYDRLKANSTDPAPNINLKRREVQSLLAHCLPLVS